MKILLTGCNGQIGTAIREVFSASRLRNKYELIALGRDQLDITNAQQVNIRINAERPDMLINSAAYTKVDLAETNVETAYSINSDGPANLAKACALYSAKLIHISTDFVFDGSNSNPYLETDCIKPLNTYGKSKAAGEIAVRELCEQHVILRTAWAYSSWGDNFMKVMVNMMLTGRPLKVINDQFGSPTSAIDIARTIWLIAANLGEKADVGKLVGTYHYTGNGVTTWYGFAKRIRDRIEMLTGLHPLLEAIPTSGYPTAARRPTNSSLNCERICRHLNIAQTDWESAVDGEADRYVKESFAERLATVA